MLRPRPYQRRSGLPPSNGASHSFDWPRLAEDADGIRVGEAMAGDFGLWRNGRSTQRGELRYSGDRAAGMTVSRDELASAASVLARRAASTPRRRPSMRWR